MTLFDKLKRLEQVSTVNYWSQRIVAEMLYVASLSKVQNDCYNALLEQTADFLLAQLAENHAIIHSDALKAEEMLAECAADAKKYTAYCVSHAHIDMNWMWGYQETASVTVDTFRTILNLMNEYPTFTYAQSQASVYKIIETYAPEMLAEIKQRVHEGRWELSASTWVETDKNMPNGESLSRHILYAKRYLAELFDIDPDSIRMDFEPDTFGHNRNVPEILQNGGVDYYYHCRGYEGYYIYNWKSPSGKQILVHRDPKWYNGTMEARTFSDIPIFCNEYGINVYLNVYGVGDHGGGPTRRDIETILDMQTWPLYPNVQFGTYHEYFAALEKFREKLPVVDQELNFVFTGCYTSQSRIKMSNRLSEDRLYDSELLSAEANVLADASSKAKLYGKAWQNVLFNHFHDILPGSGVIETREYAMGLFQDTLAYTNTNANTAMRDIASKIDTSSVPFEEDKNTIAEGGGVGFAISHASGHKFPQTERGRGKTRVIHLFNTTAYDRQEPVEITIWDYTGDIGKMVVTDCDGNPVPFQFTTSGQHYWGHNFTKIMIDACIPSCGYNSYIIKEGNYENLNPFMHPSDSRCDAFGDDPLILENEEIRAVFDAQTLMMTELTDKASGQQIVTPDKPSCIFRYIQENTRFGMTAWRVGPYMQVTNLHTEKAVRVVDYSHQPLRKYIRYEIAFQNSKLNVLVMLHNHSKLLDFDVTVDWQEVGSGSTFIPQLNFYLPVAYTATNYKYDIPFGTIVRSAHMHDVPANSFMEIMNDATDAKSLMVVTDSKYGFRGCENSGAVTLIRSSYDPDPYPELGQHHIKLGVGVTCGCNCELKKLADCYVHDVSFASGTNQSGSLPMKGSFVQIEGKATLSSIKNAEDSDSSNAIVLRVSNPSCKETTVKIIFAKPVQKACLTDILERKTADVSVNDTEISFALGANCMTTVKVIF